MLKNRGGFTLFEVMITMAVSASMLVVAITLFSGQQQKTQFSQGMRDLESSFQDVINDTATGYFPSSSLTCTSSVSGPQFDAGTTTEQGANQGCVFLGKAIHIRTDQMDIYPVVGNSALTAASFQAALPVVVPPAVAPSLIENKSYLWGLHVYDIFWNTNVTSHLADGALIAIVSTPNGTGFAVTGDSLNSGIQRITTLSSGPTVAIDQNSSVTDINNALQNPAFAWVTGDKVTICLRDDNNQKGGIVLSGGASGISARIVTDTDTVRCS